jgi:hypothetical protein
MDREAVMRGTSLAATVMAIGASVLAVGCGQQHTPGSGAGSVPKFQVRCVTPKLATPGRTFTITNKDNGKAFCVPTGTGVFVFLHGTPARMWTHLHPSSAAIVPRASGKMALMVGETGGYYVAMKLGSAVLTSSRTPCHALSGSGPGCVPGSFFRVTLVIRGRA